MRLAHDTLLACESDPPASHQLFGRRCSARLQVCSTVSTAYVHGGRTGVLPEVAVHPAEPPSRWCPLVDRASSSSSLASGDTVNGHSANGGAPNGASPANGYSSKTRGGRASVPGKYLDLGTELEHAKVERHL